MSAFRVWWIPQVPMPAFHVEVPTLQHAGMLLDVLAQYDLYQYHGKVKGDFANAGGVTVFEDGEWLDWYSEEGDDFDTWWAAQEKDFAIEYSIRGHRFPKK